MRMKDKVCDVYKAYVDHKEIYIKWSTMFKRCYSENWLKKYPSYEGCFVCDEWFLFSNFKNWCEKFNYSGLQLDKDLLGDGKLYSPDTCCFLPQEINKFLTNRGSGITQKSNVNGYIVQVCMGGKKGHHFTTIADSLNEAKQIYLNKKMERATILINKYKLESKINKAIFEWVENKFGACC